MAAIVASTEILAASQSRRSTGAVKTLSTNRFARGLARNTAASGTKARGTRKYAMTPYPSSQVSWVPTVATQPTASRITAAPSHANLPRIVALSSSTYRVPTDIFVLNLECRAQRYSAPGRVRRVGTKCCRQIDTCSAMLYPAAEHTGDYLP